MKIIVIACVIALNICSIESKPHVEVERQRLIEIAIDDTSKGKLKHQSEETKRIYQEISKINEALGYAKRAFPAKVTSTHEGYFYPRATEQLHLPLFLRTPTKQGSSPRYIAKKIIGVTSNPFNQQTFYYPAPYLHLPLRDEPKLFRTEEIEIEDNLEDDNMFIYRTLPKSLTDTYFREVKMTKFKKNKKIKAVNSEVEDLLTVIGSDDMVDLEAVMEDDSEEEIIPKVPKVHNDKYMMEHVPGGKLVKQGRISNDKEKIEVTQTTALPVASERPSNLKTFGSPNKSGTKKPSISVHKITLNEPEKEAVKTPNFGQLFQTPASQAIKDVMKEGGIVIQRLKVRKGGIAIAGPGGVATAGSGGTAIVGPGGLALTHPRGLSIAGPGARVVSIPEHVDLQKLALKSSARSIPIEGMLVATGPIVYYNP